MRRRGAPHRPAASRPAVPPAAVAAIAGTVLLWSSAFVGVRFAVASMSPVAVAVVRYVVASAVLAAVSLALRQRLPGRRAWARLALVGVLGITVYNLALNYGSVHIQAGAVSFLINTAPILTAVLAVLLLGERVRPGASLGIGVGFAGAVMIILGQGREVAFGWSALVILLAAAAQSLYFVLQKPLLAAYSPLQVVSAAVWVGTLAMLPFAGGAVAELAAAPAGVRLVVVYLGVFPAALAYVLWSFALARTEASTAASWLYCVPPTTVVLSWLLLGEAPAPLSLAGGAVALLGVWIVNNRRTPAAAEAE